jgi:hypothetical protein
MPYCHQHYSRERKPNKDDCIKVSTDLRDIRLAAVEKLNQIKSSISTIEEYKKQHPESDLSELKLPVSFDVVKNFLLTYDQYDLKKKYAFIRPNRGKWISSQNGERPINPLEQRDVALGWEVFGFEEVGGGKVAIHSCGKYLSSENGVNPMRCDRQSVGTWEQFDMIEHGDSLYSFKGSNGRYVSTTDGEGHIMCNSEAIGDSEKFLVLPIKDLADEINIGWSQYETYFTNLFQEYDAAVEEKKKIDPEKFYITNEIEVYHEGSGHGKSYFTNHEQRLFNQKVFKVAMKEADEKIYKVERIIEDEVSFINSLFWRERNYDEEAAKMLKKLIPAICLLEGKTIPQESAAAANIENESGKDMESDDEEDDEDSYIVY